MRGRSRIASITAQSRILRRASSRDARPWRVRSDPALFTYDDVFYSFVIVNLDFDLWCNVFCSSDWWMLKWFCFLDYTNKLCPGKKFFPCLCFAVKLHQVLWPIVLSATEFLGALCHTHFKTVVLFFICLSTSFYEGFYVCLLKFFWDIKLMNNLFF